MFSYDPSSILFFFFSHFTLLAWFQTLQWEIASIYLFLLYDTTAVYLVFQCKFSKTLLHKLKERVNWMLPSNMLQNADEINKTLVPGKVVAQHKRWHQPEIFPLLPKSKCCDRPGEPGRWVRAWLCRGWAPWRCGSPVLCVYTFRNFMSHLCIKSSHLTNSCLKCHVWHPLTILSKQGHCLVTVTDTLCCQVTWAQVCGQIFQWRARRWRLAGNWLGRSILRFSEPPDHPPCEPSNQIHMI